MTGAAEQFRAAMLSAGLTPPDVIEADGELHRFSTNNKRGDDAGWYVLHGDGIPAGAFGDWRAGPSEKWRADIGRRLTSEEDKAVRRLMDGARERAEAERQREAKTAAQRALSIWESAEPAQGDHPYLVAKGVKAHGLRLYRGGVSIGGVQCDGALIVPVRDASGEMQTVEFITADGVKRFLSGGKKAGGFHMIGEPRGTLCIVEGYATAASVYESARHAVAVAFDAGNLAPVARALADRHRAARIIICADNDESGTGQKAAKDAACAVGALIALPAETGRDWNDVHRERGLDAVRAGIEAARRGDAANGVVLRRMSDIQAQPVLWLWLGRIARGKVSMLAGDPGLGKSQICASLAAIVTTGGLWPVDRSPCDVGSVLILSAEDDAADTIRPRLEAAGADLDRVHILDAVKDMDYGRAVERGFDLSRDLDHLSAALDDLGDVALVVIDPITSYLGATDSHKTADVRAVLSPLGALAAKKGVAILAVNHMRKSQAGGAMMQITGSMAFVAHARAAYVVAKDRDDPERRLMLPAKNNIGNDASGYAFRLESIELPSGIHTSRVAWEPDLVTDVTADEAAAPAEASEGRSALEEAAEFLRELLADGPMPAKRVLAEAREAGHAEKTIRRACRGLVDRQKLGGNYGSGAQQWVWALKMAKTPEDGQEKTLGTFSKVGHLQGEEGQFPM
jgi:putative DNA primase/helicase